MTNQLISAVIAALIRVESEANRLAGRQLWTLDDRWNQQLSRAMCKVTLEWHYKRGVTDPVELACRWRNPYSHCPEWYAAKVRRALGR